MPRFLSVYLDPTTGRERLGTGAHAQAFHRYANVRNVVRFGLAKPAFPAGQYHIYAWPEGGFEPRLLTVAYKRVTYADPSAASHVSHQPVLLHRPTGHDLHPRDVVTCGTCERRWCEVCNPTPSARCAFEHLH